MQIPIQNIYFLLCYAWNTLQEKDLVDVQPLAETTLADLFARVLISGTRRLVRRGLDRDYVSHSERTSRLKGRVLFGQAVHRWGTTAALPCEFDEFNHDVLHNQILKATMRRLRGVEGLDDDLAKLLTQLCRLLADVREIELGPRVFGQIKLHRGNRFYGFLLSVCELIHRNLLVSEMPGQSTFRDFVRDERQMSTLYEAFVRNFYDHHTDYEVRRENIAWQWIPADEESRRLLPRMQTDISLTSAHRKIIVDCKYTPEATKFHRESEKLRSGHLYQVYAYLSSLAPGARREQCEVILLYPTVGVELALSYADAKGRVSVRTINLNQSWQAIHNDLLRLVA